MTGLVSQSDVEAALLRPLSDAEAQYIDALMRQAEAKLRQACPWDLDQRITLYGTDPSAPTALDPDLVAGRLAIIIKRFLANPDGAATTSEAVGPFSRSATWVNRYDKTGADVRGELRVTPEDIDELRPSTPAQVPSTFQVGVPAPQVVLPRTAWRRDGPMVVPDWWQGRGVE